jgi:hypothetical protein
VRNRFEEREYIISLRDNTDTFFRDHLVEIQIKKKDKQIQIVLGSDFWEDKITKKGFLRNIRDKIIKILT